MGPPRPFKQNIMSGHMHMTLEMVHNKQKYEQGHHEAGNAFAKLGNHPGQATLVRQIAAGMLALRDVAEI